MLVSLFTADGKLIATNCKPEVSFALGGGVEAAQSKELVHRRFEVDALQTPDGARRPGRTVATHFEDPTGRDLVLIVATSDEFVTQLTRELRDNILLAIPVGIVASLVSGWLIAGIAVRPINRLQEIAQLLDPESLGTRIDIGSTATEVARLQNKLNEARRRLDTGYKAQEQFAANVSHELKTPLAIIVAQADLLKSDSTLPEHAKQFVNITREEAMRLARLCESFMLLARVRHGKSIETTARPYTVNLWIMDCVGDCRTIAKQHQVEIKATLLEEDHLDAQVVGDKDMLSIMLDNIIRNACRFSPPGGTVEISAHAFATNVQIAVRDYGPGIPPAMLEKIFEKSERFVQAENTPLGKRGNGIGLQIAQGIAQLHKGDIDATNCQGGGCLFTLTFPLSRPAAVTAPASMPPATEPVRPATA
jgi:signal transduction histidine kinase